MNILIADDFEPNRRLLRAIFSHEGFRIFEAGDGVEALQILERERAEVVVSDILMPNMDGYRLCAEIRRHTRFRDLPFVFYTSTYTSPSDERLALELGADLFIRKPAPASVLVNAVRELMAGPRKDHHIEMASLDRLKVTKEYTQQLVAKLEEKNDELHRRTQELRETSAKLESLIHAAPAAIVAFDPGGNVTLWNPAAERMFGWTAAEVLGQRPPQVDAEHLAEFEALRGRVLRGETLKALPLRRRRRDGTPIDIELSAAPLLDAEKNVIGKMAVLADITDLRKAEEALRRRKTQFEEAQGLACLGSWDWDIERDALLWSEETYRMFGVAREGFTPSISQFFSKLHPDDREWVKRAIDDALAGRRPYNHELRIVRPDGSVRTLHARGRVAHDAGGRPVRMSGMAQDITERKLVEAELESAKARLEALSRRLLETSESELRRIARELHDEIGQTLTAAKLEIQAARRTTDPGALALRLDDSLALIEHLLKSVRELSLNLRPASLDALGLAGALRAHVTAQTARAELDLRFHADDGLERFDAGREIACFRVAQEALTNVIRHARASVVEIDLRRREDGLHLRVRDDGAGFDCAGALARAEAGATFGLVGMRERVELTGGRFSCSSAPGAGAEVRAFFRIETGDPGG